MTAEEPLDALVLTALQDELDAVLALGEGGREGWREARDLGGFRYFRRSFPSARCGSIHIAAAWIGEMGERSAAIRGQQLLTQLSPECLAMCGICAGYREEVSLGDVIIADRIFSYDHGKLIAEPGKEPDFLHDIGTFDLESAWKMDAAYLAREIDRAALSQARPPSAGAQRRWLLHTLYAAETDGGAPPVSHPDRRSACPSWTARLREALQEGLIVVTAGHMALTDGGRERVLGERLSYPDGLPEDPPLRVRVGAVATGKTVRQDPELFTRLRHIVRTTIGVEMEGAAVGELAARSGKRAIVIKAVSDHADADKDDSFRAFACRASAEVLIAFLQKQLDPARRDDARAEPPRRERAALEHADRRFGEDRRNDFLARVERVARLRDPGATITPRDAPAPFAGVLEIEVREGAIVDLRLVGALEQPVTEALVQQYVTDVEHQYRRDNPSLGSTLIDLGPQAPAELARQAHRRGLLLKTFPEYQGLVDFTRYLDWQTRTLEADPVYPPGLYVEQPAKWSLAGGREEQATEKALATLWELLEAPHPRFALVLGDFGAGKTFLLHELARRMGKAGQALVPVLVEMSRLEKQQDLKVLLAQHFARADMGRFDPDAFMYMLGEGRIALLFDGFDELALRLTYDRALEHFQTVMAAAQGNAKVVVTSRTQHFLTEQQVRRELAKRAEAIPGYRLMTLDRFGETQIRRFLGNLITKAQEAEERYALIDDVKDLLGLSENPRMLGFIAKIAPEKLREAKAQSGEITAARLYEILVRQWLDFEHLRANPPGAPRGVPREKLAELVTKLAGVFWERNARLLPLGELGHVLVAEQIEPGVVEHMIGSGSLLVRDREGRFSFVHRSVLEWLVADDAARALKEGRDAPALGADEMSELMVDFLLSLAGLQAAESWAYDKARAAEAHGKKNAARVLKRIELVVKARGGAEVEVAVTLDLEGQDLRGQDWSGVDWQGASLSRARLEGATLREADLRGATLIEAGLGRADLTGAKLGGADLMGADMSFARLSGADLRDARGLVAARLRGAKLVGALGVDVDLEGLKKVGAAPPAPRETEPMSTPASPCNAVAWSPIGDLLASGHQDGSVLIWDLGSGRAVRTLAGHLGAVQSVAFSPDGNSLASGSDDNTLRLWDVASGRSLRACEGHEGSVQSVAFSPDGNTLASGSYDKTLRLWDVASGRSLRTFEGHRNSVQSVAFSPDGNTLASGSYDNTLRLWDVASGRSFRAFEGHKNSVQSVAFSPDGNILASGSYDNTLRLWDVASGRSLRAFEGHTFWVSSVAFSPDGNTLASGSYDYTLRLWDVASGSSLRAFEGHKNWVQSVAFSPDGNTLASGSSDHTLRLWDVASGSSLRTFEGHADWVLGVAFSPDGNTLASGFRDNTLRLWDVATGRSLRAFVGHTMAVGSVAFSPDGNTLASGSYRNTLRLWDVASGRSLRVFVGHTMAAPSVAFSPDGNTLASGSYDNTLRLWDVASGRSLRAFEGHSTAVLSVAFSPDGNTLASGSSDNTLRLWDATSGLSLRAFEGHTDRVLSIAFSPDGSTLASGSADKTLRLWDVASGRSLRTFGGHNVAVNSIAFSPDGLALASGSADKTLRLWDVASGRSLRTFGGHKAAVNSVAFSPDGLTLASASDDGTLRLWRVSTGRCLAILLATPEGWAAFTPDGRYKLGGDIGGSFWHVVGLCRFEPGELDPYLPLRLPDDARFDALPEPPAR